MDPYIYIYILYYIYYIYIIYIYIYIYIYKRMRKASKARKTGLPSSPAGLWSASNSDKGHESQRSSLLTWAWWTPVDTRQRSAVGIYWACKKDSKSAIVRPTSTVENAFVSCRRRRNPRNQEKHIYPKFRTGRQSGPKESRREEIKIVWKEDVTMNDDDGW